MRKWIALLFSLVIIFSVIGRALMHRSQHHAPTGSSKGAVQQPAGPYLGFDRNDYPGDANLALLRKTFQYTGYWLSNPPGEMTNTWVGKRSTVEHAGFGFLVLFNGRKYAQLKHMRNPGAKDGERAVAAARKEGFPNGTVIFLDMEEGGRMLPEQKAYVLAWADTVNRAGFRAGVYCSGISVEEDGGGTITTAQDLHESSPSLVFWVANDACPPAPGCAFPKQVPGPKGSGAGFAQVWQYAQSPVRKEFAQACAETYAADGNCYAPELGPQSQLHLDLNASDSPDPSHARTSR